MIVEFEAIERTANLDSVLLFIVSLSARLADFMRKTEK